mgnify:CR=1 FL=1
MVTLWNDFINIETGGGGGVFGGGGGKATKAIKSNFLDWSVILNSYAQKSHFKHESSLKVIHQVKISKLSIMHRKTPLDMMVDWSHIEV